MKKPWKTLPTIVAVSVLAAIYPAYGQAAEQQDAEAEVEVAKKSKKAKKLEDEIEVIEVTGLRSSLLRASELKRSANSVIDVISAEDVGNFPDENVVESLQRVTGVQVLFGENGSAGAFQVRGVSQNRIELNGRSVAGGEGTDPSRDVNLADFPSELIDSLEVIKSPTAALTEGSLGATINLKTKRPLSVKNSFLNVNAKAKYGDEVDEVYPNINIIGTHSWRDTSFGDFGMLINLTHNDNHSGGDVVGLASWGNNCPMYSTDNNGLTTNQQALCGEDDATVYRPNSYVLIDRNNQNRKNAIAATFQWAPNDSSSYTLDIVHNDTLSHGTSDVFQITSQTNWILPAEELGEDGTLYAFSNVQTGTEVTRTDNMGRVIDTVYPVTAFDSSIGNLNRSTAQANHNSTTQTTIALKGKWDFDTLGIQAEVAHSKSDHERHYIAVGYNGYYGNPTTQNDHRLRVDDPSLIGTDMATAIRQTGTDLSVDLTDPRTVGISLANGMDPNDLRSWRVTNYRDDGWIREPTTSAAKIDFDYFVDYGVLESIEFGGRFARDVMENASRFRFVCNPRWAYNADGPHANSYDETIHDACEEPISAVELAERYPGINGTHDGFYSEAGNVPTWTVFDLDMYRDNRSLWNEISGFNDKGYEESPGENYTMTEDTTALYVMGNFNGDVSSSVTFRGNIGVRAVRTKVSSETYNALDAEGNPAKVELENTYDNYLPSMNIAFAHEDYGLVRLAAARTMVRPALGKLLPVAQLNNFQGCAVFDPQDPFGVYNYGVPNPNLTQAEQELQIAQQYAIQNNYNGTVDSCPGIRSGSTNIGNIELTAQTSDNVDLSFERYWGKGNMASLAFFYRNVQADLVTKRGILAVPATPGSEVIGQDGNGGYLLGEDLSTQPGFELWRIRSAFNGEGTTRKGIELGYTQWLDFLPGAWSGLGFSLNYTYTEGTRPAPTFIDSATEEELDLSTMQGIPVNLVGQEIPTDFVGQRDIFDQLAALGDDGPLPNGFELLDHTVLLPISNMSEHSGNISIFYDKGPLNMRLAGNYRSEYYNAGELNWPKYFDDVVRADFSSSYKITKNLKVQFNINNILKTVSHSYRIDPQLTDRSSYSDRIFTLGMSYRFQ
ncbi:TonB-dependent receptor [Psychrosphaera sp. 1_MG-2023]|uniref:TonB-dependent receptor n=1 Tax=Psychrosphaera sp. 1_MG-2023 TaxID=3062643 RepID=UPI0026E3A820|nr:TonB-dependent receptor [Psychrosphaera sp. 1_MG-2023]MDO6721326.1 TonB-dependent receptor [Psychrosphaera sp. 1_MG-2023]